MGIDIVFNPFNSACVKIFKSNLVFVLRGIIAKSLVKIREKRFFDNEYCSCTKIHNSTRERSLYGKASILELNFSFAFTPPHANPHSKLLLDLCSLLYVFFFFPKPHHQKLGQLFGHFFFLLSLASLYSLNDLASSVDHQTFSQIFSLNA